MGSAPAAAAAAAPAATSVEADEPPVRCTFLGDSGSKTPWAEELAPNEPLGPSSSARGSGLILLCVLRPLMEETLSIHDAMLILVVQVSALL